MQHLVEKKVGWIEKSNATLSRKKSSSL